MKFAAIHQQSADFGVAWMCRVLGVSRSGYYASLSREPSSRRREDLRLAPRIAATFHRSRCTYGSPRIRRELREDGLHVGRRRIARLMRDQGLIARRRKRFRRTTDSSHDHPIAPNLLNRCFERKRPNQAWVADITYVRTWSGWLYVAVIIDLYSRRVVGWAATPHLRTDLALAALGRAIRQRKPPAGLVHHSDRGSQYASREYRRLLARHGIESSMSRKGNCWDNAVAESFFSTLKTELIHRCSFATRAEAVEAIGGYVDGFYNPIRKHSTVGYVSPVEYESGTCAHGDAL